MEQRERDYIDNLEAAELQSDENSTYLNNNLDFEKWKIDPEGKKSFDDINKDSVLANISKSEMLELKFIEAFYIGCEAIHHQFGIFGDFFLPKQVKDPALRKKYSTLALSNSKDGFRLKIIQSKLLFKSTSESKESSEKKSGWNFLNRKKKEEGDQSA